MRGVEAATVHAVLERPPRQPRFDPVVALAATQRADRQIHALSRLEVSHRERLIAPRKPRLRELLGFELEAERERGRILRLLLARAQERRKSLKPRRCLLLGFRLAGLRPRLCLLPRPQGKSRAVLAVHDHWARARRLHGNPQGKLTLVAAGFVIVDVVERHPHPVGIRAAAVHNADELALRPGRGRHPVGKANMVVIRVIGRALHDDAPKHRFDEDLRHVRERRLRGARGRSHNFQGTGQEKAPSDHQEPSAP